METRIKVNKNGHDHWYWNRDTLNDDSLLVKIKEHDPKTENHVSIMPICLRPNYIFTVSRSWYVIKGPARHGVLWGAKIVWTSKK